MCANYAGLPAARTVNELCHNSSNHRLIIETGIAALVLAFLLFALCTIQAILQETCSYISGNGFWSGSRTGFEDWLFSTAAFVTVTVSALVLLAQFARIYLRSTYGGPFFSAEIQTDLPHAQALNYCRAYMSGLAEVGTMSSESANSRLVCLMRESNAASTYLDLRVVELENNHSLVYVRSVSIPYGRAALLSSYYNDLGASRMVADGVLELFSAQQSQTRTAFKRTPIKDNRSGRANLNSCPPPLLTRSQGNRY